MPIKSKAVQRVLNVSGALLLEWHREGLFYQVARHMYERQHINAFLSRRAHFYSSPPRWQDVQTETFLRPIEVERQFGIPRARLERLTHSQQIPHILLPGRAGRRYQAWYIQELLAREQPPQVSLLYASQVLGHANTVQVSRMLESGVLERAFNLGDQQYTYVTRASFLALLRTRLPPWVDGETWLKAIGMQGQLLFSEGQTAIMLGLSAESARTELDRRKAQYIMFGDEQRIQVLYSWIVRQFPSEPTVSVAGLRRLFGATAADARRWVQNIAHVCPVAYHPHAQCPGLTWRSCWIEFVKTHCSPDYAFSVRALLRRRLDTRNPPKLLTVARAAHMLGCERETVEFYAQSGIVNGYQTPDGEWRFEIDRLERDVQRGP